MGQNVCKHPICIDSPGKRILLMGNEAFARGAIEAGVKVAAGYPGTPSSEIIDTLERVKDFSGVYVEWSVNEKVAAEVAFGASISGLRALTTMKHYGLNVMLDFLTKLPYIKIDAGFVIISADDPQSYSSGSEQDSRFIASEIIEIPALEPANPQEAKDMCNYAFDLSEKYKIPTLIRSVTRVGHTSMDVILGKIRKSLSEPKIPSKHALIPGEIGVKRHEELHAILKSVEGESNESTLNFTIMPEKPSLGIITSGIAYEYVLEALNILNATNSVGVLKIGIVHPAPSKKVVDFAQQFNEVLIIEEGEPYLEKSVKSILFNEGTKVKVSGKEEDILPRWGELTPITVAEVISRFVGKAFQADVASKNMNVADVKLPGRLISLCPGCPHRATGYALKMAVRKEGIKAIYHGDIGCYALVGQPPLSLRDTSGAMGSSIGIAIGVAKSNPKVKPVALIGDSTLFHAGLPALANATYDEADILVVVFDNGTTAMTGFQPNPGEKIAVEDVVRAIGAKYVKTYDPYNVNEGIKIFQEALRTKGPAVVIARHPCALKEIRVGKRVEKTYMIDQETCINCGLCINHFGCSAIYIGLTNKPVIDPILCVSCGVCAEICPVKAIKEIPSER